jgi:RHS repeat-associated protein
MSTSLKHTSGFKGATGAPATLEFATGKNWISAPFAYMSDRPDDQKMAVVLDTCSMFVFDYSAGPYQPLYGGPVQRLSFDSGNCLFRFVHSTGDKWYFTEEGLFDAVHWSSGEISQVTERNTDGNPTEITRSVVQDGQTITDSISYSYYPSGDNAGLVSTMTTLRTGSSITQMRRTVYTYYNDGDCYGGPGDLRTATEQILSGVTWVDHETNYFRYYKAGQEHGFANGIKYSLGPQAFARLQEDPQVTDPFLATDAQVARFADRYFEYDSEQRVTKSVTNAGLHVYTYAYEESAFAEDYNNWALKIVQTRPDGSTLTRYNNFLGQTMLTDLADGSNHWLESFQFDESLQVQHASPSAVVSYDDSQADLDVVLESAAGLISTSQYYPTTTATPTTPGGAEGFPQSIQLQEGTGGTPITQREVTYFERTDGIATIYPVAESTVFRDDAGTEPIVTSFAYTWFGSTIQTEQQTKTLPIVPTAQNGTNTTDTITQIYDELGNLIWNRDPRGYITFQAYDLPTGEVIQSIQDVDGAKLTLPAGWSTPAGGGLHLITDYEIDALGRTTQSLGPPHEVLGQIVRTASWSVYQDLEDEVRSAQGYATGERPEYAYTLVNPVSLHQMSHDGRVSQSITAVRECEPRQNVEVPDAGMVESPGRLSAGDCFPQESWVRWSVSLTDDHGQQTSSRTYHQIPESGAGTVAVNYDETRYGYDIMGRRNKVVSATGTISRRVFDVLGQKVENWLGTDDRYATDADPSGGGAAGNNMVQISGMEYDGGSPGGDGNLTERTAFVDDSTERVTTFEYDFRNRKVTTDGEVDYFEQLFYDNLNHVIQVDRRNTNSGGNLIARSETLFDDRRRVYRTLRYAVDPSTGTVGSSLVDNTWYDRSGNVLCLLPSGSNAFTKSVYDGIGRTTNRYAGYNPDAEIDPSSVDEDKIFEQSTTQYDAASNVLLSTTSQRFHNATGLGPLNGPSGMQPKSRDSFMAMWADGVGRTLASANYGTDDNAGPPERPAKPPESSELILVSRTNYNERGEAFESIDPAGKVDRTYSDNAGRTVRTISNFVASSPPGCLCAGSEQNVTTEMHYGFGGQMTARVAKNPETGDQITQYQYGVTFLSGSDLVTNDLISAEIYPDSSGCGDQVSYGYNRQGQRTSMRDQNGSVHKYAYDLLGRQTADAVTTVAAGIDDAVLRIGRTYEVRGMAEKITSYDAASSGTVVNEVQNDYNNFAQLETQYQEHAGSVNTGTSPKVGYAYEDGSANTVRPTLMTYPSGQVLQNLYDDADADNLSRIRTLNFDGTDVAQYSYLGLGTFVTTDYPEPQIKLDYASGSGINPYTGYDRFGRVIDLLWQSYASSSSSSSSSEEPPGLVHLQYTHDQASNRTSRADVIAQWYHKDFDELYEYDGMHRLTKFHRGRLAESDTVIESPTLQQGWRLDATGNWRNFTQNDQADPAQTLDQQRISNRVNEITTIARTVGANWATPEYDRNGNMALIPQPKDPTLHYRGVWDAWNRLVRLEEPDGLAGWQNLQENNYNGYFHRNVVRSYEHGSFTKERHCYFANSWQVVEERLGSSPNTAAAERQFSWGKRYINDLVLRDRDTDGDGVLDERLYALQDANWNIVAIASSDTGQVVYRLNYTCYGYPAWQDSSFNSIAEVDWEYSYSAHHLDSDSWLYLARYRMLSCSLGVWLSKDPIALPGSPFQYVSSNPIGLTDPFGMAGDGTVAPDEEKARVAVCEAAAKANLLKGYKDPDSKAVIEGGGVICYNGKAYACIYEFTTAYPGEKAIEYVPGMCPDIDKCSLEHEEQHKDQVDCKGCNTITIDAIEGGGKATICRPSFKKDISAKDKECPHYLKELDCLFGKGAGMKTSEELIRQAQSTVLMWFMGGTIKRENLSNCRIALQDLLRDRCMKLDEWKCLAGSGWERGCDKWIKR